MPSLNLDGRDVELEDLLPEELQAHLDHCRLLFPRWRRGYQVVLAGTRLPAASGPRTSHPETKPR
ncbi:MAG: hypothetical protein EOP01_06770 [Propionibacteriaceae bacterium]|nr:MAG: hypothetical protein EOP01_06770 [Propionibacteriaceae bacterium]